MCISQCHVNFSGLSMHKFVFVDAGAFILFHAAIMIQSITGFVTIISCIQATITPMRKVDSEGKNVPYTCHTPLESYDSQLSESGSDQKIVRATRPGSSFQCFNLEPKNTFINFSLTFTYVYGTFSKFYFHYVIDLYHMDLHKKIQSILSKIEGFRTILATAPKMPLFRLTL